jgi:hypothetical protein
MATMITVPVFWVHFDGEEQRVHDGTLYRDDATTSPMLAPQPQDASRPAITPGDLADPIHLDLDLDPATLTPEQRELLLAAVRRDRPHFRAGASIAKLFTRKELDGDTYVSLGELIMGKSTDKS